MFRNVSIRKKLVMQTVVPIVIIMILALLNINFTYSKVKSLEDINQTIDNVNLTTEFLRVIFHGVAQSFQIL